MQFAEAYSHHNGRDQWAQRDLDEWLTDVFVKPDLGVGPGSTTAIRDHVKSELAAEGWPFDVKIDQSFSRDVNENEASKAIIEAVCRMARRLSMNVVVEGIETEQQRIAVQLLGAQRAQGYLFGRPEALKTDKAKTGRSVA